MNKNWFDELLAMAPYRFSPAKDIMNRKWIDVLNRINGSI